MEACFFSRDRSFRRRKTSRQVFGGAGIVSASSLEVERARARARRLRLKLLVESSVQRHQRLGSMGSGLKA